MKNLFGLLVALSMLVSEQATAQETSLPTYRRSSIWTVMLDESHVYGTNGRLYPVTSNTAAQYSVVKAAFEKIPIPEKFNDHNLNVRCFNLPSSSLQRSTENSNEQSKKLNAVFERVYPPNVVANALIAQWYNQSADGKFNMDLIAERGLYDATELQAGIAAKSTRGRSMLKDAGQELIRNTFVVVIQFKYTNKEDIGAIISAGLSLGVLQLSNYGGQLASEGVSALARGYIVKVTACLYQLDWDENTQRIFETKYWNHPGDLEKASEFTVKLIGDEVAWADVQSTKFSKKTEAELIERATIRATDAVISKLQRKYEAFRVKTPLLATTPEITAQIGLKEGLEPKDKYEVLEQIIDPETGLTTYQRVTVLSVEKGKIWDNRYNAGEERHEKGETADQAEYTTFKGKSKNIYPGMLIRQIN